MNEYVKIKISFKEKILFLFTGLISKSHLINKTDKTIIPKGYEVKDVVPDKPKEPENQSKVESIPFFDFQKGDETRSNL